jgi:hypothetical protein
MHHIELAPSLERLQQMQGVQQHWSVTAAAVML